MTNDEFQKLVLEELSKITTRLSSVETNMATKQELADGISQLDSKLDKLALITQDDVIGMLTHVKVSAEQIDERLENIEDDINYLARKSAKYGNEIGKLKKTYKKTL
jgi:chaperonin cofactor prefoldin